MPIIDGYQLCNCSGSHGQEDVFPHSLYNVSCAGIPNSGQQANACAAGRCTWHNQSDGSPMIDTLKCAVSIPMDSAFALLNSALMTLR